MSESHGSLPRGVDPYFKLIVMRWEHSGGDVNARSSGLIEMKTGKE